jgi:hypothetical protein
LGLDAFRQDVPPAVEAILRRLLAKDPAERYQTPGELAAQLAPHAGTCAPTWDDVEAVDVGHAPIQPPCPPPSNDGMPDAGAEAGMIATLPSALTATPISGFAEGQILPCYRAEDYQRRLKRTAFFWSIGIVALLAVTLVTAFFLLSR